MNISENASYLKGLAEGMEIDSSSKEGKLIVKLIDVVSLLANEVEELRAENDELYGYLEEMARDIIDIENDLYDDAEDEEDYEDYSDLNDEEEFEFDEDEEYYEVECPSCGEKICFTEELDLETLICPACGEKLSDVELLCDECDDCDGCDSCDKE